MTSHKYQEWFGLVDRMVTLTLSLATRPAHREEAQALHDEWSELADRVYDIGDVDEAKRVFDQCKGFERRILDLASRIEAS